MTTEHEKTGFSRRLARLRREQGHTNAQALADAVQEVYPETGITRGTIVNLELGREKDPTVREVVELACTLGVPPVALLFDLEDPFGPPDDLDAGHQTNLEMLVWLVWGDMPPTNEAHKRLAKIVSAAHALHDLHKRVERTPNAYAVPANDLADRPEELSALHSQLDAIMRNKQVQVEGLVELLVAAGARVPDHVGRVPTANDLWTQIPAVEDLPAGEQPERGDDSQEYR